MNYDILSVKIFKALGHPIRYKIVKFLCDGPKSVNNLSENVEFSKANLSQHLRILKDSGIVICDKISANIIYKLCDDGIIQLIDICEKYTVNYLKNLKENII